MSRTSEFLGLVTDQMASLGGISTRAMFGGHAVYRNDAMFALVFDDQLYFKTDATSRAQFAARGLKPFVYSRGAKTVALSYFEAPAEVLEETEAMQHWARLALEAAKSNRRRAVAGTKGRAKTTRTASPAASKRTPVDELSQLRNIGKAMRADFELLGIKSVAQLARCNADRLYARIQKLTQQRHDPCVWDTYAAAIHQAKTGEGLPWWEFTKIRKARSAAGARRSK